ncbi:MAG: translation elongation factor Ts [Magnetococcus sp. DMHC-6]
MSVSASTVKLLREKTGAGMMDCKKALTETDGDLEAAIDWLRKKGLSAAVKKAGRVAAEGKVVALSGSNRGVLLEVNTETDFAAKNGHFISFADTLSQIVLTQAPATMEALLELDYPDTGRNVGAELTYMISTIGENMNIRRFESQQVTSGLVANYIHMGGKIGVLVALESDSTSAEGLNELGKKLAMHIAASAPPFLDRHSVPAEVVERERAILMDQARDSGKPEAIIEKMVQGRISKFYGESCFLEQPFVMDPDMTVTQAIDAAAKGLGAKVQVTGFSRFVLGDGIEKEVKDFAQEVAQQLGQ